MNNAGLASVDLVDNLALAIHRKVRGGSVALRGAPHAKRSGQEGSRADRTTVLYIGGIGRSGTTLLERSIGQDGEVVQLGEVMHLWKRSLRYDESCGCGSPFSECEFWGEVGRRAFGGWSEVDIDRVLELKAQVDRAVMVPKVLLASPDSSWGRAVAEYASYYVRIYQAAAHVTGARVVVDSSKQSSLAYILAGRPELDLRVLHCVRDARAVAHAWGKEVVRPEARTADVALMTRYRPSRLSMYWMVHNAEMDGLGTFAGVPKVRVRYEDWVTDPRSTVLSVREFAGLDDDAGADHLGDGTVRLEPSHSCSGNPSRFATGVIEIRPDRRWIQDQSVRARRTVSLLTWPLMLRYGYRMSGGVA
ncbi:sulfotransferase [Isoptericola jiangsuensis]|uniref:sulfotransferase n=1 Tax=Isoptericola jiangsuensis TaxID=548579 RepID=UPI003AAF0B17